MIDDRHYTPQELASQWGMSDVWIRRRFKREPGVVKLGRVWRIPESVVIRVYTHAQPHTATRLAKYRAQRQRDGSVGRIPRANMMPPSS